MPKIPSGFPDLDKVLGGGIQQPCCICVSSESVHYAAPLVFQMAYTFLQDGLRGLYVCLDCSAEETIAHFKEYGFNIDRFSEDFSIFFLDFFSQSQDALIESAQLGALLYNPDESFMAIGQFMDWIKNGFLIIDTISTFTLNLETKKAYEFVRALKLLSRTFNLITIAIAYTAPLDAKTAELLRSVSDGNLTVEKETLHVNSFLGAAQSNERLIISRGDKGRLVLRKLLPSGLNGELMDKLEKAFSEVAVLKVRPTLTLTTLPEIDLPIEKIMKNLYELSKPNGLLEAKPYCSSVSCPNCGSDKLYLHLKCPDCVSLLLEKGETLEHFSCGHVAFRPNFEHDGKLICPKCHKELRQIGVDYRQIGSWYKCSAGHISPNAQLKLICAKCHAEFDIDNANLTIQKTYELTEKGKQIITVDASQQKCVFTSEYASSTASQHTPSCEQ
ncbi:MAG: ATPase domain-containing protein [Candidatus Bathyarchaeia archaeon]